MKFAFLCCIIEVTKGLIYVKRRIICFITVAVLLLSCMPSAFAEAVYSTSVTGDVFYDEAANVLKIVNQTRAENGKAPLKMDKALQDAAMLRAAEISIYFSHTRPDATVCFTAVEWENAVGENIAMGQWDATEVMVSWNNSEGHHANIINEAFTSIGIGCFADEKGYKHWVQLFDGGEAEDPGIRQNTKKTYEIKIAQSVADIVDFTPDSKFTDVKKGNWYYEYVEYATQKGLFNGLSEFEFGPNETMTRAMFVTVLSRIANANVSNDVKTAFSDVAQGKWYTGAVSWAAGKGVVTGVSDTEFAPDAYVTRQQMCAMLIRYANSMGIKITPATEKVKFTDDNEISDYAKDAVYVCQSAEIVNGMGEGKFAPKETATRAQVAKIFSVFHKMITK